MQNFPLILADGFPLIGLIFLIIWGISALASLGKKKKQQQRSQQERETGTVFFPEMQEEPAPPPVPESWPPRRIEEQRPAEPVGQPGEGMFAAPRPHPKPKRAAAKKAPKAAVQADMSHVAMIASEISRTEIGAAPQADRQNPRARRLSQLLTPRSARQAVVLAELLSPPLALREGRQ